MPAVPHLVSKPFLFWTVGGIGSQSSDNQTKRFAIVLGRAMPIFDEVEDESVLEGARATLARAAHPIKLLNELAEIDPSEILSFGYGNSDQGVYRGKEVQLQSFDTKKALGRRDLIVHLSAVTAIGESVMVPIGFVKGTDSVRFISL